MRYIFVLLLVGCAVSSGVVSIGPDTYMLAKSAPGESGGEITADLYREANTYCAEQKKQVVTISSKSRDSGFARKGTAEIQFRCQTPGGPEGATK